MQIEWTTVAEGFAAGAFPWISQFKKLPIHFELPGLNLAAIFNFFASLFAVGLYTYCVYAHPTQVARLPEWYWLLLLAFVLTCGFFFLFVSRRDRVKTGKEKWPIYLNFLLYVAIFAALTSGFGSLKLLSDYVVVGGTVVDAAGKGVPDADVELSDQQGYSRSAVTERGGQFRLLIDKRQADNVSRATVNKQGWCDKQITLSNGFSAAVSLRRIELKPVQSCPS